jgi:hypothetical protein
LDEIKQEAPSSRSTALVETPAWLEPEMGNQRPARQKKRHGPPQLSRLARKECHGLSYIDQRDIAHIELQSLFVVGHR